MRTVKAALAAIAICILSSCSIAIETKEPPNASLVARPDTPEGLTASVPSRAAGASSVAVDLSWAAAEDASSYIIRSQTYTSLANGETPDTLNVTNTSATVNCEPDEVYVFSVVAVGEDSSELSDESDKVAVSTLVSIEELALTLVGNSFSVIIRHADTTCNDTELLDPVFFLSLTQGGEPARDNAGNYVFPEGGTEIELTGDTWSFSGTLAGNETYDVGVRMVIDGEEVDSKSTSFTTSPQSQPTPLSEVDAAMAGDKVSITVSFTAPPVNNGLGNVERRFQITRTSSTGESVEVLSVESVMEFEGDFFHYTDSSGLEPNVSYTYSVLSWYLNNDTGVYYRQESSTPTVSNAEHIYSVPASVSASIEAANDELTSYTETVTFLFPFGLPEGATPILERKLTGFQAGQGETEWEAVAIQSVSASGEAVTLTSTLKLSADEAEKARSYTYRVSVKDESGYKTASTEAGNTVTTTPTVEPVGFATNLQASNNQAGQVTLSWEVGDNLDSYSQSAAIRVVRSASASFDNQVESPITWDEFKSGSWVDSASREGNELYDGQLYHYALDITCGENSETLYATGSSLSPVTDLTATDGQYTDRVELKWSAVGNASGYEVWRSSSSASSDDGTVVYGKIDLEVTDNGDGTRSALYTEGAGTSEAGMPWMFMVKPVDSEGRVSPRSDGAKARGSLLGPATLTVDVSRNEFADRIEVKWNAVPGANLYELRIYTSETAEGAVITERLSDTSYTLTADDSRLESMEEYPLSTTFWFSVHPQYNDQVSEIGTERKEGSWIMPPRSIKASKAESSMLTTVTWDSVDGATGYHVYRRRHDSADDWSFVGYTSQLSYDDIITGSGSNATNPYYEYTVSTVISAMEGERQNYFETTTSTGIADNVGFPLYHPEVVDWSEFEKDGEWWYDVSFEPNQFATGYVISSTLMDSEVTVSSSSISDAEIPQSEAVEGDAYIDGNGRAHIYIKRPMIRSEIYLDMEIASRNDNIQYETDKVSESLATRKIPQALDPIEVVHLFNTAFSEAFSLANAHFSGDWWGHSWDSGSRETTINAGGGTISAGISRTLSLVTPGDDGYLELSDYTNNGVLIISGRVTVNPSSSGGIADSNGNEAESFDTQTAFSTSMPLNYGKASISFSEVGSGSGTYTVVYGGTTSYVSGADLKVQPI